MWPFGEKQLPPSLFRANSAPASLHYEINDQALVKRYSGWVYACVRINAEATASIPLRIYSTRAERDDSQSASVHPTVIAELKRRPIIGEIVKQAERVAEVFDTPLGDLLKEINPGTNAFEFIESISTFNDLTGNAIVYIVRDLEARPRELWMLPSQFVKVELDTSTGIVKGYRFPRSSSKLIPPDDIIHFKLSNPLDAYWGFSPIRASVRAADLLGTIEEYEQAMLNNMGIPDTLILLEGNPKRDVIERLLRKWKSLFGGHRKAGRVGAIGNVADVKRLGMSAKEMSYQKGLPYWRREIGAILGVPESLLVTENINLANLEAGIRLHAQSTVFPRLKRIEQKLNERLVPMFGDPNLFVAFDNPVPNLIEQDRNDMEARLRWGVTSRNEERARMNRPPLEYDEAEVPMVPMNMRVMGEEPPSQTDGQTAPNGERDNASILVNRMKHNGC